MAALLVSLSPRLESLAFSPLGFGLSKLVASREGSSQQDYVFREFLRRANEKQGNIPFMQNLRMVRFLCNFHDWLNDGRFYEPYDVYESLNLVRRLPALEAVRFEVVYDDNPSIRPPPRSANYTKIGIHHSALSSFELSTVIESAKELREFTYNIGGRASGDRSNPTMYVDKVLKSLLMHRHTLESLDLDVEEQTHDLFFSRHGRFLDEDENDARETEDLSREEYEYEWADELDALRASWTEGEDSGYPLRLESFGKLKHLGLGAHVLYYLARGIDQDKLEDASFSLVDHLPHTLESLRIYGYSKALKPTTTNSGPADYPLVAQISKLLEEKGEKLPNLKVVEGVDEPIPNGDDIENPDADDAPLWNAQASDEEWTDYEY